MDIVLHFFVYFASMSINIYLTGLLLSYATPPYLKDIYRKVEEKEERRQKEKYAAEYVCGTMGWRDYNVGNLSVMKTGDLGVVQVKMKRIIKTKKTQDNFDSLI